MRGRSGGSDGIRSHEKREEGDGGRCAPEDGRRKTEDGGRKDGGPRGRMVFLQKVTEGTKPRVREGGAGRRKEEDGIRRTEDGAES